ncbi:uncharacterized protein LOC114519192 [Dendronephthya gigantea]|uniref:uncharacterized protein LOC114519192 n=1 Tax=Dendronephthya gigantea TaxID=151771 RepID=UPI00106D1E07|nr:uncharacterized protein LOC114519192 [Dendronephthya gigantea]
MFMRSGRKLDKALTSLFKFDKNTSATLDRLVGEIHENKELCCYQFLNHPGSGEMLAGIMKLVHSKDRRIAGNASYVMGSLAETPLGCSRIVRICMTSSEEENSRVLKSLTSMLDISDTDQETVLNAAGTLGTLAENEDGRLWLLRQAELNETIDKVSTLLSYEDNWIASNAALVLARLTISEEGCARILNHPHSTNILTQLIKSLQKDNEVGAGMNAAFATGRLCDLQTGRVRLLNHVNSNSMLDSLLKMLKSDDIACQKNACFAISCLATNTLGHSRLLRNDYIHHWFSSMPEMLNSSDEESVWFAAMTVHTFACQKPGILALRKDPGIISALMKLSEKPELSEDTATEVSAALELLEKLTKPDSPDVQVQSAYVISVKWDKIFPKSGLEVWYELYRDDEMIYAGDEDSFVVTDAQPVTKYSFRLRHTTEGDESPFSNPVQVETPESVPGAPLSLLCLNRTTSQLKVAWEPPILTNGVLMCYHVTVKGRKVSLAPFQETQDTNFILSGLLPGTEYKFEVYAVTGQGRGEPAILLVHTVDLSHHAPAKPSLSVLGRHEIQVEWDTPKEPLSRITSYEVKVNGETAFNGLERSCILRRLQSDTEYTVTVSAWTNEGRCESVSSKRRTNRDITIPGSRRPPLYPFQKKANGKNKEGKE